MAGTPSDFERMLSTFKEATGYSSSSFLPSTSNNKRNTNSELSTRTLKENVERLWNVSLLRKTVRRAPSKMIAGEVMNKATEASACGNKSAETTAPADQSHITNKNNENQSNSTSSSRVEEKHVHIAVCACIVDDLPHEHIWRRWMEPSSGRSDTSSSTSHEITLSFTAKNDDNAKDAEDKRIIISGSADMYVHAKHPDRIRSKWVR